MAKTESLSEAIRELYKAFSRYPLPEYTDPCLHCHSQAEDIALRSKPLVEAGISDLRDYAVDAVYDWGNVDCFKHFLPRIFELFVSVPDPANSFAEPEIVFAKFRHGNWRTWPADEQKAVERFLHALWDEVLDNPPEADSHTDVESWLCSIAQSEDDLTSYLHAWIQNQHMPATLALSGLMLSSSVVDGSGKARNAFWEGREQQYIQLKLWVRSEAVTQKLDRAERDCTDEEISRELAVAKDLSQSQSREVSFSETPAAAGDFRPSSSAP